MILLACYNGHDMWGFLFRLLWRIVIFVIIVYLAYATVFLLFPYLDDKLPLVFALLLIYAILAYFAIPLVIRLWRVVFKPNHIPMYVTTPDGWPADPVNIAVVANSEKHFIESMERAGWYTADKATLKNVLREGYAILLNRPYPTAPFSSLYLFGRTFDIGFQLPRSASLSPRARHHVRFWCLESPEDIAHLKHYSFWYKRLRHLLGTDKKIWIGAALDDTGPLALRWRTGQITHSNDPETDKERDFIISTLYEAHQVKHTKTVNAGEPFSFRGQILRNTFICDGTIRVVELKHPLSGKLAAADKASRKSA